MHEIPDHCWHFKSRPGLTWRAQLEALAASQLARKNWAAHAWCPAQCAAQFACACAVFTGATLGLWLPSATGASYWIIHVYEPIYNLPGLTVTSYDYEIASEYVLLSPNYLLRTLLKGSSDLVSTCFKMYVHWSSELNCKWTETCFLYALDYLTVNLYKVKANSCYNK